MQNSLFKKIDEAIVQTLIQLLIKSKFFILFDHVAVSGSDVKTINVIYKNFCLKLFKSINNQLDVIFCVKTALVVNNVKIVNQIVYANINL